MTLWGGRFSKKLHPLVEAFTTSLHFDKRLAPYDIQGSIAWANALAKAKVLTAQEARKIALGLTAIAQEIKRGTFPAGPAHEDIHMALEARLTQKIGKVGEKLHTGRSRNDQVATDLRLFLKEAIPQIVGKIKKCQIALLDLAKKHFSVTLPGYTHLQPAQPVLFSHHLLAYGEMLERDRARFQGALARIDVLPLGSGALAGTGFPIDRSALARALGFAAISENSMDAVSDRDFVVETLAAIALGQVHLSRFSEELILWNTSEFSFIELPDDFATGSSMMPQKKNPDVPELMRGKTGRVYGNLVSLLTTMKALPLAYNKDMQEDKEALFDTIATIKECLKVFSPMLRTMKLNKKKMLDATKGGFLTATDAADYLVKKGVPFRESHHIAGRVVAYCIKTSQGLEDLSIDEWRGFSKAFGKDIKEVISIEASVKSRKAKGGTAPEAVKRRLKEIERDMR